MVAAAWRDVAQLKGEGAAFVESKVCPLIFQFWSCPFQVHRQVQLIIPDLELVKC